MARRLAEDIDRNAAPLNGLLEQIAGKTEAVQADVLNGMTEGLTGWRKASKPAAWDALTAPRALL